MSLAGKIVVILGASGNVGSGAAHGFLEAGATVVLVGRDETKIKAIKEKLGNNPNVLIAIGTFDTEANAAATRDAVIKVLGGKQYDHVVSSLGFVHFAPGWPTATPLADVNKAKSEGWDINFNAAHAFLPSLKNHEGSTYTFISGGLAHITPPAPNLWLGTLKNSLINTLANVISAETANDKVRVNTFCIHFPVAEFGGTKNQFGMPADGDSKKLGPFFVNLARNDKIKGKLLCGNSADEAIKLVV